MKRLLALIILCALMTGCSVKKEGITLGSYGHKFSSVDSNKCHARKCPQQVLVIGTVSAYRDIGVSTNKVYAAYSKAAKKFLIDKPISLTEQEFDRSVKGWTRVQVYNIPLVGALYSSSFISIDESIEINYASSVEAFLVQGTGDLVSAKSNSDGLFFIEKRLCDRKNEYLVCKKNYKRGFFDANSGKELDSKFNEKKKGKVINIKTYEVLENH